MRKMTFVVCWLVLLCCLPRMIFTQTTFFHQQLDNSDGLSNSCINTVFQDSDNLLWLGTWDGLNVYNGTSFHVFNYGPGEENLHLRNNIIYKIAEDNRKNIWIATMEGITRYNKKTGTFHHYFYDESKNRELGGGFLLVSDANGNIYCTAANGSDCYYYDELAMEFRKIRFIGPSAQMKISKMMFDTDLSLYVVDSDGLLKRFSAEGKGTFRLQHGFPGTSEVEELFLANNKVFFTNLKKQLVEIGVGDGLITHNMPYSVRTLAYYNGHYITGWSSKGIGEFDTAFRPLRKVSNEVPLLSGIRVTSLKSGTEGLLWVGTDGNGVMKLGKHEQLFSVMKNLPDGRAFNVPVRSFCEMDDALLVGTKGNGLIAIDKFGKPEASYRIIDSFKSLDILDNCVYSMLATPESILIGSDAPGITLYDRQTKKLVLYNQITKAFDVPAFGSVHSILAASDGTIWLGTESFGLINMVISKNSIGKWEVNKLRCYLSDGTPAGPGNNIIYSLAEGTNGDIYVGCRYSGLSIFSPGTGKFRNLRSTGQPGSLSNNDILSICLTGDKTLWIGTSYGLNIITEEELGASNPVFKMLNTESGLPNNTVHAIIEDNYKNLWVSTNKGLAAIRQRDLRIRHFKISDGLQSNEFSDNAVFKSRNNEIFFGGIYGFNFFNPALIPERKDQPNAILSGIKFSGKQHESPQLFVLNDITIVQPLRAELERENNLLELNIGSIKFRNTDKSQYAYFLEGYDKNWQLFTSDKKISYGNLLPGDYKLKVKWSNGEGFWSKEVVAVLIRVNQYWWLTSTAFALYFAVFLAGWLLYQRHRINKLKLEHSLILEQKLREKDEAVHEEKLSFYTNLAHELQTPLTLINTSIDQYADEARPALTFKEGGFSFSNLIKQQASRLSYLVYQLLEFRKAENGHLRLQLQELNASQLVQNIIALFELPIKQKQFRVKIDVAENLICYCDKDKLEKIIYNLLSNVMKYAEDREQVICSLQPSADARSLQFVLSNSGCNLSQNQVKKLFTKSFLSDGLPQYQSGNGIGLVFAKELATVMGGSATVDTDDRWISFRVCLPYITNRPSEEIIVKTERTEAAEIPSLLLRNVSLHTGVMESPERTNRYSIFEHITGRNGKSILIVEDEANLRFLLKDMLQKHFTVYEATNGREAIDFMQTLTPNLVLSDVMMNDMSGLELCRIMKSKSSICHIPFVMLSARSSMEHQSEGYEAGADAYIAKPFNAAYLLLRLTKLLDYQEKLQDLFRQERLTSHLAEKGLREEDKMFLKSVIEIIEVNMDNEELNADLMESGLGISRSVLYSRVKSLSKMTPGELIIHVRIQFAAHLLNSTELTVAEIVYKCGFNNRSYFFREFKKKYSLSPASYRSHSRIEAPEKTP